MRKTLDYYIIQIAIAAAQEGETRNESSRTKKEDQKSGLGNPNPIGIGTERRDLILHLISNHNNNKRIIGH